MAVFEQQQTRPTVCMLAYAAHARRSKPRQGSTASMQTINIIFHKNYNKKI
jgi:hypothetical protein